MATLVSVVVFPIRARWLLERDMARTLIQVGDLTVRRRGRKHRCGQLQASARAKRGAGRCSPVPVWAPAATPAERVGAVGVVAGQSVSAWQAGLSVGGGQIWRAGVLRHAAQVWVVNQVCVPPNPDLTMPGTTYTDNSM